MRGTITDLYIVPFLYSASEAGLAEILASAYDLKFSGRGKRKMAEAGSRQKRLERRGYGRVRLSEET